MTEKDITKVFIDEIFSKVPKRNYKTNKTIVKHIDDTWSADLLDVRLSSLKQQRIDIF